MLNYEFPPLGGGSANATYYLLKEFAKKKEIKIDLVTSSANSYREEWFSDNIRIYYLDIKKRGNLHYQTNKDLMVFSWRAYQLCKKLAKRNQYDLVHAFFGIPCGYIAMKLGLPYIVSLRGSDVPFYSKRFYWLDKLFFRKLSFKIWKNSVRVIANSEQLKTLALKTAPKQFINIIPNGVDTDMFQKYPKKNNPKFTVLYVGRLIERKGLNYLLDAFAQLNGQKDCRLILVGSGDQEDSLKEQAEQTGQGQYVYFFGAVSHNLLPPFYRQDDVFVLPSLNEGMSNALLEAMASGLPVIATDTGGTDELVRNNGIIVEKRDAGSLFRALNLLKSDLSLRRDLGRNSLSKAKHMSWADAADRYLKIYNLNSDNVPTLQ